MRWVFLFWLQLVESVLTRGGGAVMGGGGLFASIVYNQLLKRHSHVL